MQKEKEKRELLVIDSRGGVTLPEWAWKRALKMSRIRSKKKRHQRKAVKKQFMKLVLEAVRDL